MKHFEDFAIGEEATVGAHHVTSDEIVAFGCAWDPQPTHTDPVAAAATSFGGLIASSAHVMAIAVRLLTSGEPVAIIAALAWDDVRFLAPARPGDVLTLSRRCISVRASHSRPDQGIVRNALTLANQTGGRVLSFEDTILVRKRAAQGARSTSADL